MEANAYLDKAYRAAVEAEHIFAEFAACESALESAWGESRLAREANNLFGQKKGKEEYPTIAIPTREWENGQWVTVPALWPKFPDWKTSFMERMALLRRRTNADKTLTYQAALDSKTGADFVRNVSKFWATDPLRADKVLQIYNRHFPR